MRQKSNWRWWPRFSLKTFLIGWLIVAGGTAWIARSYRQCRVEQEVIQTLTARLPGGSTLHVARSGRQELLAGNVLM